MFKVSSLNTFAEPVTLERLLLFNPLTAQDKSCPVLSRYFHHYYPERIFEIGVDQCSNMIVIFEKISAHFIFLNLDFLLCVSYNIIKVTVMSKLKCQLLKFQIK